MSSQRLSTPVAKELHGPGQIMCCPAIILSKKALTGPKVSQCSFLSQNRLLEGRWSRWMAEKTTRRGTERPTTTTTTTTSPQTIPTTTKRFKHLYQVRTKDNVATRFQGSCCCCCCCCCCGGCFSFPTRPDSLVCV